MPLTEEDVTNALRDVFDPELPVNIVDLGLVYGVKVEPDPDAPGMLPRQKVAVEMTMTTKACTLHPMIVEQVRNRLAGIREISESTVDLVWEPAWTPDRISPAAQKQLGIAPFHD